LLGLTSSSTIEGGSEGDDHDLASGQRCRDVSRIRVVGGVGGEGMTTERELRMATTNMDGMARTPPAARGGVGCER
jgi:hypothetical protein